MIELFQVPYSPYCLALRRLLEYSGAKFKLINVPNGDRSLLWKITRQRYYQVPVVRDGRQVLFETDGDSQVIAKYLDQKLGLTLFPAEWEGVQSLVWRYFENDVEGIGFKLNDIYWRENVPKADHCAFVRHKERKFGRGCLEQWREQEPQLRAALAHALVPAEQMLHGKAWLLGERPLFVDFCLYGMLANVLYSGHHALPAEHQRLRDWYERVGRLRMKNEK